MKILVCVKQISTSDINMNDSDKWIAEGNTSSLAISRFDENALEEAILLKERLIEKFSSDIQIKSSDIQVKSSDIQVNLSDIQVKSSDIQVKNSQAKGTSIDVISVGGVKVAESIKRGMGMGADNGIHIIAEDKGYVSASVTASRLAKMVKKMGDTPYSFCPYDLILTGIMSEDLMQAQVGPMLAEYLNIPCVTSVVNVKINQILNNGVSNNGVFNNGVLNQIEVQRELEGGIRQNIKVKLPALLTIQAGINQPRYPSLSNILRANKKQIQSCYVNELFVNEVPSLSNDKNKNHNDNEPINFVRLEYPEKKREGRVLNGTTKDKATELMNILKQRGLLI